MDNVEIYDKECKFMSLKLTIMATGTLRCAPPPLSVLAGNSERAH